MGKRGKILVMAFVTLMMSSAAWAQIKTVPGEMKVVKGSVEAVDHAHRVLTVKDKKGEFITVDIPEGANRFSQVKVGDKITLRYYDTVTVRVKKAGEKDVDTLSASVTPVPGEKPAGTVAKQRTMTARIESIDRKVSSVTFVGPNGWKYSRRVSDKKILGQVKVGDRVDFIWTEAVMLEIQTPKK
jgi:hypothetical protein